MKFDDLVKSVLEDGVTDTMKQLQKYPAGPRGEELKQIHSAEDEQAEIAGYVDQGRQEGESSEIGAREAAMAEVEARLAQGSAEYDKIHAREAQLNPDKFAADKALWYQEMQNQLLAEILA